MFTSWYFADKLPTWALFAELLVAGGVVVLLASMLTNLADRWGDERGLGKAWVGMLILATVTSLPEVVTGAVSVWIGQPDMAFAAIFGSCSFNLILITMINAIVGGGSVLGRVTGSHTLTSSFGIILMGLAIVAIVVVQKFQMRPVFAQVSECTLMVGIVVCYFWFMRLTFRFGSNEPTATEPVKELFERTPSLGIRVCLVAVLLMVSAWWLTKCGDVLAVHPIEALGRPLGASFVGAAFLAMATSLPEVSTTFAAVRLGHLDLALGNIFGSNMFNILVVPLMKLVAFARRDVLLLAGPSFSPEHATQAFLTGLLPILMTGMVVASLAYRTRRRVLHLGMDSFLLAVVYAVGMYLLFAGDGTP